MKYDKELISLVLAGTTLISANAFKANAEEEINYSEPVVIVNENDEYSYIVRDGDTLSGISVMFYGNPKYYKSIAIKNKIEDPYIIYEGQTIQLPKRLNKFFVYPYKEYEPDKLYTVQEEDYLFKIAKMFYENPNIDLINKLATYNDLEDPNIIEVDQTLLIPCIEKLECVIPYDYSLQYILLEYRVNNPGEEYPDYLKELIEEQKEERLLLKK